MARLPPITNRETLTISFPGWRASGDLRHTRANFGIGTLAEERIMLAPSKRQMHLGVFWIGAGNHSAGWRYDGAWTSNSSWPAVSAGARIAERGKFDLFFISDSLSMDPGDHPSFITRSEEHTSELQ